MPETAVYNPVRQCEGKLQYQSKRYAKRIALLTTSGLGPGEGRENPRKAGTYRCPWCGFWHVGHKPPKPKPTETPHARSKAES